MVPGKVLEPILFGLFKFKCPCPDVITGYSGQAYYMSPLTRTRTADVILLQQPGLRVERVISERKRIMLPKERILYQPFFHKISTNKKIQNSLIHIDTISSILFIKVKI